MHHKCIKSYGIQFLEKAEGIINIEPDEYETNENEEDLEEDDGMEI